MSHDEVPLQALGPIFANQLTRKTNRVMFVDTGDAYAALRNGHPCDSVGKLLIMPFLFLLSSRPFCLEDPRPSWSVSQMTERLMKNKITVHTAGSVTEGTIADSHSQCIRAQHFSNASHLKHNRTGYDGAKVSLSTLGLWVA